jgi:hypothetical protein
MSPLRFRCLALAALGAALPSTLGASFPTEPGLLFHLSADHGSTADFSAVGQPAPTFDSEVTAVPDGARGPALRCGNLQRLAWRAPGHLYAQRGTVAFFWRSRELVGPTEFPLFRVAFSDHSSWDMVFLRIDYNGHGFDAFVTDTGLARIRVSTTVQPFPAPAEWTHLAFTWDENTGVRLYVNGRRAAAREQRALLDAGLDQFGPHSRVISPHQVQSDYNFVRGGDIDELRTYDCMLDAAAVAALAANETPVPAATTTAAAPRSLADPATATEWAWRHGWNRPTDLPPPLPAVATTVRKVEIHDAYDLKRWWWKACDGIRETTWPGIYNRSRLPGRNDYFQLPDWDCYVESGKSVTFTLPAEPVNHLEIAGPAFGSLETVGAQGKASEVQHLFDRPRGQEKTVHRLAAPLTGGGLRFTNTEPETPIEEFSAYHVAPGAEPAGRPTLAYRIDFRPATGPSLAPLETFVRNRHPACEQAIAVAVPASEPVRPGAVPMLGGLPVLNILIPAAASDSTYDLAKIDGALDGIALDLPAFATTAPVSLNIRVKDPLWPARDLLDFTFTVAPNQAHTLWLDLRDRLLPPGRGLYLTIAASAPLDPSALAPALRLVFKPAAAGRAEHAADRFTQVRDAYGMFVEERPGIAKYDLFNRLDADLRDLMRVAPDHVPGRNYAAVFLDGWPRPPFALPKPPAGVPAWAFNQVELLGRAQRFAEWYVDHRQVPYGDFGGGISDDTDLLNLWPGLALMGCAPDKLRHSLNALLDAAYANGMFRDGLSTIQTDELHSYEEGINCLGANLILDYASPRQIERAMATTRGLERLTGVNAAGHRHIRSSYFSGTKFATEEPWGWAKAYSHLVLQTPELLADFNGHPRAKQLVLETADGLLAHRHRDADGTFRLPTAIKFATDENADATRGWLPWPLFWNAWQWTGDRRYLAPVFDLGTAGLAALNADALDQLDLRAEWGPRILAGESGEAAESRRDNAGRKRSRESGYRGAFGNAHFAWQLTGDKKLLEQLYAAQIEDAALLEYINTEGSLWIDRVGVPTVELQRARLGGVALVRNAPFPGHTVSWRFAGPATAQSVAILLPVATPTEFKVIAYNLETMPVRATLTGWAVDSGLWEIVQGIDTDGDDRPDHDLATRTAAFERTRELDLTLPPRATSVLTFRLKTPGTPYWQRPELGIDPQDVIVEGDTVHVTIHSLGSIDAPATTVALLDSAGRIVSSAALPAIPAPLDLVPKTGTVALSLPAGFSLSGSSVVIDPEERLGEITRCNNTVRLP